MISTQIGGFCKAPYCVLNYCSPAERENLYNEILHTIIGNKTLYNQIVHSIYNATSLRILWEIASDGIIAGNYTASSYQSSDKNISNVKTDIIEQYWQSTGVSSEWIQFDAGAGKKIFLDTLAFLGHNLTTSAVVKIYGYGDTGDSAPMSWSGVSLYATITMPDDQDETSLIWISSALPPTGYRHWRITIEDSTNSDGYLRIGRVVGGAALIFVGNENQLDIIDYQINNFKDEFKLNGFSNIANNRAQKKYLRLRFNKLDRISLINYRRVRRYINYSRDTLKALIIPDPQDPYQFTVYAKLKEIPTEQHQYIDQQTSYASMDLIYDEGR